MTNPFKIVDTQTVGRWGNVHLIREDLELPDGNRVAKHSVKHPGAVVIIPRLDDGRLLMVRQYRHAVGRFLLEFPAGTLEPGERPEACARRELVEEVGHRAERLQALGSLYPAPGFCDETQYCFLADGLVPEEGEKDPDEIIEVRVTAIAELEAAVADMQIDDAKTLALFARARTLGMI